MTGQYFLGVDGGQSSTTAVIGDESGRVLGMGRGGPVGPSNFLDPIKASLRAACSQAGLDPAAVRFASACLGLSGGPADKQAILGQILASDRILVTDDARIALSGALAGEPGIVTIAGTGSIAFGRNAQGSTARAGGWGYLFGDEGGGFWIVREAIRAALRWEEGWGSPTALRGMLLDATGARNMNDLMHRCYTPEFPRSRVASLALLVNYAVENGDPLAREILRAAASELALLVRAVRGTAVSSSGIAPLRLRGRSFPQPDPASSLSRRFGTRSRPGTGPSGSRSGRRSPVGGLSSGECNSLRNPSAVSSTPTRVSFPQLRLRTYDKPLRGRTLAMARDWQNRKNTHEDGPPLPPLLESVGSDIAVRAHCLRVATWSSELAGAIGLSESDRKLVEQAAISHHMPELLVDEGAHARLLAEMRLEAAGERPLVAPEVRNVLETLWGRRPISDPTMGKIVAVLEISDDFDQYFESQPLFDDSDAPDEYAKSSVTAMMSYLQVTSRADITRIIDRLPVFPRAAREVVRQVANPDVGPRELEAVCSLDPLLAGRLIQIANSAFYSPRLPIGTIFHAVSFIGIETTRRVLLAAALRGHFASPESHRIWNHSLDVAQTAEMLALHCSGQSGPSASVPGGFDSRYRPASLLHYAGPVQGAIPSSDRWRLSRRGSGDVPVGPLPWRSGRRNPGAMEFPGGDRRSGALASSARALASRSGFAALSGGIHHRLTRRPSFLCPLEHRLPSGGNHHDRSYRTAAPGRGRPGKLAVRGVDADPKHFNSKAKADASL